MMRYIRYTLILVILSFTFMPLSSAYGEKLPKEMKVHFIDVGQGDSILIETPNEKYILIDGGRPEYGTKVLSYLEAQKVKKLDLVIATHPDYDHIGGLVDVMREVDVKQVLDSGKLHHTRTYARYLNEIRKQDILFNLATEKDEVRLDSELTINVLNTHKKGKNSNQSSIVLKMTYKDMTFLFMGDVGKEQEKRLVEKYNLKADIIKIAHHGSKTSSSMKFLKKVDPKVALLTYKKRNRFGHPVDRVVTNLNKLDTFIYSTAVFGDIIILTNGKDYFIETEKSPNEGVLEEAG